jgi:hypothetical protein
MPHFHFSVSVFSGLQFLALGFGLKLSKGLRVGFNRQLAATSQTSGQAKDFRLMHSTIFGVVLTFGSKGRQLAAQVGTLRTSCFGAPYPIR